MPKREMIVSPKGCILYPFLFQPSTKFNAEGVFKVDLELDPKNAEHKTFLGSLKNMTPKGERAPYRKQIDKESNTETGLYIVSFKSSYKPNIFDAKGKPITQDCNVGNGTEARVAFYSNHYEGFGGGINLYLQGVQIINLVEYQGASADSYGFGEEEGYEFKDNDPFAGAEFGNDPETGEKAMQLRQKAQQEEPVVEEDDLPF